MLKLPEPRPISHRYRLSPLDHDIVTGKTSNDRQFLSGLEEEGKQLFFSFPSKVTYSIGAFIRILLTTKNILVRYFHHNGMAFHFRDTCTAIRPSCSPRE